MTRVRTQLGLHSKNSETIDGYTPQSGIFRLHRDDEGNVYGGIVKHVKFETLCVRTTMYDSKTGVETYTRKNKDFKKSRIELERLTGKSLTPVNAEGVIPTLKISGFGYRHVKEGHTPKWYNKLPDTTKALWDGKYTTNCLPLLVPKKYTNKLKMVDVSLDMMTLKVEPDLKQFTTEHGIANEVVQ